MLGIHFFFFLQTPDLWIAKGFISLCLMKKTKEGKKKKATDMKESSWKTRADHKLTPREKKKKLLLFTRIGFVVAAR